MAKTLKTLALIAVATAIGVAGLFWSGEITSMTGFGLVTEAQAVIGRPLTPMSYAGVARRTVRRCAVGVYYC